MQYRIGLGPYSEGLINFKIAGLRDPREQTHIDIYFGNSIASKYQRVITFPTTIGYKRRVFASQITDNFRIHTAFNLGPSFALSIPYFRDFNNNNLENISLDYSEIKFSKLKDILFEII